jgi:hypothetical protein
MGHPEQPDPGVEHKEETGEEQEAPESVIKTITAADGLIFETAMWLVIIPVTLLKALWPPFVFGYVVAEANKRQSERYRNTLPPTLIWLVTGVLPVLLSLNRLMPVIRGYESSLPGELAGVVRVFDKISHSGLVNVLIIGGVLFALYPLSYAIATQLWKKEWQMNREKLRPMFEMQCLLLAPYWFFTVVIILSIVAFKAHSCAVFGLCVLSILLLSWRWVEQVYVVNKLFGKRWYVSLAACITAEIIAGILSSIVWIILWLAIALTA